MHRSGTSVTTHVLNELGVRLSDDLMAPTQFNQKGYFESNSISSIHEAILRTFGLSWATSTIRHPLPPQWWQLPAIEKQRAELVTIVKQELEKSEDVWGFKDPRTARLLPLWIEIARELDVDAKYVLVSRHPRDCAMSLYTREQVPPLQSELLWLEHTADVLEQTQGKIDALVRYEQWFSEGMAQAEYLIERLGLEHPGADRLRAIVDEIVSGELRHHREPGPAYELPFTAEFDDALNRRDAERLAVLTNIFAATRRFSQLVVGHSTRELIGRANLATRIANERTQQVVALEARLRALESGV